MALHRNLVETLHQTARDLGQQPRGIAWGYATLMNDAAYEIKRLQAGLAQLQHVATYLAGATSEPKLKDEALRMYEAFLASQRSSK